MKDKPLITIIIPTFNRAESLTRTLDSLVKQEYRAFEVFVVEGAENQSTRDAVNRFSGSIDAAMIVKEGGLVAAENAGLAAGTGEIAIRTDDDVVMSPQWLKEIVAAFKSADDVGGVSGPTLVPEELMKDRDLFALNAKFDSGGLFWRTIGRFYRWYITEGKIRDVGRFFRSGAPSIGSNYPECLELKGLVDVDYLEACNMAVRRDILDEIGQFDYHYVGIGEYNEPDISFKVRRKGYRLVFNPKAVVHHLVSQTGIYTARPDSYYRSRNLIYFYLKNIRLDSFDKFMRFGCYLTFYNGYWFFKFLTTRNVSQLKGLGGTISALFDALFKRHEYGEG